MPTPFSRSSLRRLDGRSHRTGRDRQWGLGDIGRAVGIELARRGADVALGDLHDSQDSADTVSRIESLGRASHYRTVDVRDTASVEDWVMSVETDLGLPTLIVPNAATVTTKSLREITAQEWTAELRATSVRRDA